MKKISKYLVSRTQKMSFDHQFHPTSEKSKISKSLKLPDIIPDLIKHSSSKKNEMNTSSTNSEQCSADFTKMQSVQPYNNTDEYLLAMKEDLAEWFSTMYNIDINSNNFFEVLGNGSILCHHANHITAVIRKDIEGRIGDGSRHKCSNSESTMSAVLTNSVLVGACFDLKYRENAKSYSFAARDNVSNFINWARNFANVRECLMFETDDLIMLKNERNFILCLLEVARFGSHYGVEIPKLVRFEKDIALDIQKELDGNFQSLTVLKRSQEDSKGSHVSWLERAKHSLNRSSLFKSDGNGSSSDSLSMFYSNVIGGKQIEDPLLDEVLSIIEECCRCPKKLSIYHLGPGKYRFGSSKQTVYLRKLNDHLMVNTGKHQWDTFQNYINQYDPCRKDIAVDNSTDSYHLIPEDNSVCTANITYDVDEDSLNECTLNENVDEKDLLNNEDQDDGLKNGFGFESLDSFKSDFGDNQIYNELQSFVEEPNKSFYSNKNEEQISDEPLFCSSNDSLNSNSNEIKNELSFAKNKKISENADKSDESTTHRREGFDRDDTFSDEYNDQSIFKENRTYCTNERRDINRSYPVTTSRLPRLTIRDISGKPISQKLTLGQSNQRRSKSVQPDKRSQISIQSGVENGNCVNKEIIAQQGLITSSPVHYSKKKYVTGGRSNTDSLIKHQTGLKSHRNSLTSSYTSESNDPYFNNSDLLKSYDGSTFRENKAYRWRRKALLFRNYMRDNMCKDERIAFADKNLHNNFHYPDIRGSELIYGDEKLDNTNSSNILPFDKKAI